MGVGSGAVWANSRTSRNGVVGGSGAAWAMGARCFARRRGGSTEKDFFFNFLQRIEEDEGHKFWIVP